MMKKSLIATAVATVLVLSTSAVFAAQAPVTLDGSIAYQYRDIDKAGVSSNANKATLLLNANSDLGNGWGVYGRLAVQHVSNQSPADFNTEAYAPNTKNVTAIDQFGLNYKTGDTTYKIGRQPLFVGATGLIYDSTGYLGKHFFTDGVTAMGKNGALSYQAAVVQEDDIFGPFGKNKIYTAHADYAVTPAFTYGATLGRYNYEKSADGISRNVWAVNAAYNLGSASFYTEYAQTDMNTANKSFDYGVSYKFDDKNSISANVFRVEQNGEFHAGMTTWDSNSKGTYYTYGHKFTKDTSLNFLYKDIENITSGVKTTNFRTTASYNF